MKCFDTVAVVDWSANGAPKTGADSIWIAVHRDGSVRLENPATRAAAVESLRGLLKEESAAGRRALVGLDFPFGYPRGLSQAIRPGGDWRDVWARIATAVTDSPENANNRFEAAATLNALFPVPGPFWGNGLAREIVDLPRRKPGGWGAGLPENLRVAERAAPRAQEVWKLSGAGAVGGQALTGIAAISGLRAEAAVWPFEPLGDGHVLAEVFPSLVPITVAPGAVKDAVQVETLARALARLDAQGALVRLMDRTLPDAVLTDEATILGLADVGALTAAARASEPVPAAPRRAPAPMRPYLKDPAAIYRESFRTVRAEARLDRFDPATEAVAVRLIHACGMIDVADRLAVSPGAAEAGRLALAAGAPILCDCEMVAAGILRGRLPSDNPVLCTLNDPVVPELARALGTTRSAAAVELWHSDLAGAVVAIGNAPTALFHLLEALEAGVSPPALVLGFPVGFVGAAEAKAELAARPRGAAFITLRGRRGGSAMAAAAVNAEAAGLPEVEA